MEDSSSDSEFGLDDDTYIENNLPLGIDEHDNHNTILDEELQSKHDAEVHSERSEADQGMLYD